MYLVVFLLLGGTSSILRIFWAEPVKKTPCRSVSTFEKLYKNYNLQNLFVLKIKSKTTISVTKRDEIEALLYINGHLLG